VPKHFLGEQRKIECKSGKFAMRPSDAAWNAQTLAVKEDARTGLRKVLALDERTFLRKIAKHDRKRPAVGLQRRFQQHIGPAVTPVLDLSAFIHGQAFIQAERGWI
jgi:hypothetical protein